MNEQQQTATPSTRPRPNIVLLVIFAVLYSYVVLQAILFAIDPQTGPYLLIYEFVPLSRWILLFVSVAISVAVFFGALALARGRQLWLQALLFITGWALLFPLTVTVRDIVFQLS